MATRTKELTAPVLIVGSSADASDLRYGSGFTAVDPVVFLHAGREKCLVVPVLELGRARQECPACDVAVPSELGLRPRQRREVAEWARALLERRKIRRVLVSPTFPAAVLRRLERAGVRVTISKGPVYPGRAVKSEEEIAMIRATQRAAVAAMRAAVNRIARARVSPAGWLMEKGARLSAEHVKEEIETVLMKRRCHARDTIVACGRRAADPHDRGKGPLRAGETIVLDIFPRHSETGYWGDITRTVVRGRASDEARRMYVAVLRAQRVALGMIRAGRKASVVHNAVRDTLGRAGFATGAEKGVPVGFFHGTGHGVGLDIHEAPSISTTDHALKAGHVVTVEPGLYYPKFGGVRIEDTVEVTRGGFRFLATCPKVFEI